MKEFAYQHYILCTLALVCAGLSGCQTSGTAPAPPAAAAAPAGANAGRLIIRRSPNLGAGLFLTVSVDGVRVADLSYGQTYDGPISPGRHLLSAIVRPNLLYLSPTQMNLTVESGKTYMLTAMWQGQTLVLR